MDVCANDWSSEMAMRMFGRLAADNGVAFAKQVIKRQLINDSNRTNPALRERQFDFIDGDFS
jgi:hypothetical protein